MRDGKWCFRKRRLLVDLGKDAAYSVSRGNNLMRYDANILVIPEEGVLVLSNLNGASAVLKQPRISRRSASIASLSITDH